MKAFSFTFSVFAMSKKLKGVDIALFAEIFAGRLPCWVTLHMDSSDVVVSKEMIGWVRTALGLYNTKYESAYVFACTTNRFFFFSCSFFQSS